MKKFTVKLISLSLCIILCLGSSGLTAVAADAESTLKNIGVGLLEKVITAAIGGINSLIPDSEDFLTGSGNNTEGFFPGTLPRIEAPTENACWSLGYGKVSLVPDDWQEKDYYLGGFIDPNNGMVNKVEEIIDDMQARVIALDDGSGRGISVFVNIDCIGFSGGDIKNIRLMAQQAMPQTDFSSINISCTHTHSCIDTQGLWTNLFPKLFHNLAASFLPFMEMKSGVDEEYMQFVYNKVVGAIDTAVRDMTPGTMTFAVKNVGEEYFNNKNRKSASALIDTLARFTFTPFDKAETPTMIVNIAAHPDVAGLPVNNKDNGRDLSGDYVYYLGEKLEEKGYNFMFFNGAIAGVYEGRGPAGDGVPTERRYEETLRYGYEMAYMALNLTNTAEEIEKSLTAEEKQQIEKDKALGGDSYTLWYEDWEPTEEKELSPLINLVIKKVKIPVTNPLIQLVGKLKLVNYSVYKENDEYFIYSEIGYLLLGETKIALMPGEIVQDLVASGSSLTAEGSFSATAFPHSSIYELFGSDTLCFGLMNDSIGYVVPDNDYSLALVDDHYQEMISPGKYTASSIMKGFGEIAEEIK